VRARGIFTASADGPHTFTLTEVGRARLLLDGQLLLDGMDGSRPRGPAFFGAARAEIAGNVELAKGQRVSVDVEYCSGGRQPISAFRIGCQPPEKLDLGQAAEDLAGSSDAVVLVVGTTEEWESEGFDRDSLALPADQDDLIERVLARNPRTVVVVNAGSPVAMAWADQVPAILQSWLAGQEMGAALADVLVGSTEPGGRLPVTIPEAIELTPAYGNFPDDGDSIVYGERLLVGYKWYQTRGLPVRFPFGHGLSFTTFAIGPPALSKLRWTPGDVLEITLDVANTGSRAGSEVVQCYVEPPQAPVFRPARELKAFCRVNLPAGERTEVTLRLNGRSFAHWHHSDARSAELRSRLAVPFLASASFSSPSSGGRAGWRVEAGTYQLHLGRSSADIAWSLPIEVDEAFLGS
jgi:beta-glucosidase